VRKILELTLWLVLLVDFCEDLRDWSSHFRMLKHKVFHLSSFVALGHSLDLIFVSFSSFLFPLFLFSLVLTAGFFFLISCSTDEGD